MKLYEKTSLLKMDKRSNERMPLPSGLLVAIEKSAA